MSKPTGARAYHLAQHRAYSRIAAQLRWTPWQREVYWKRAAMHLREARRLKEKSDARRLKEKSDAQKRGV